MRPATFFLFALVFSSACHQTGSPRSGPKEAANRCVTIVTTNDVHGTVEAKSYEAGPHRVEGGGLLLLSGVVEAIRETSPNPVLLLDAGDIYQGTLVSNHSYGESIIALYNEIGFDAAVLGNHEFDFGDGGDGSGDELAVVKKRVAQASFPFVAANVYDAATDTPIQWPNAQPSVVLDAAGVKVGIIGASTTATPETTKAQNVVSLRFPDPVPIVEAEAAKLRAQGAELIVFLAHMGSNCADLSDPNDPSSCDPEGEMVQLIRRLAPGTIDVAAGGHTHRYIAHWIDGVATVEAGAQAHSVARIDACLGARGRMSRELSRIHPPVHVCATEWAEGDCDKRDESTGVAPSRYEGVAVVAQPKVVAAAKSYLAEVETLKNRSLAITLPHDLTRGHDDPARNLGAFIVEGLSRSSKDRIAVQNRGGVRADLDAGELRYADVFEVSPFGNSVAIVKLTPEEIRSFLQILYDRRNQLPYVAGLEVSTGGGGLTVNLSSGAPWDSSKRYEVATNDFIAYGGDGFAPILASAGTKNRTILNLLVRDALQAVLRETFPAKSE